MKDKEGKRRKVLLERDFVFVEVIDDDDDLIGKRVKDETMALAAGDIALKNVVSFLQISNRIYIRQTDKGCYSNVVLWSLESGLTFSTFFFFLSKTSKTTDWVFTGNNNL